MWISKKKYEQLCENLKISESKVESLKKEVDRLLKPCISEHGVMFGEGYVILSSYIFNIISQDNKAMDKYVAELVRQLATYKDKCEKLEKVLYEHSQDRGQTC